MTLIRPNLSESEPLIPRVEPVKEMISVKFDETLGKTLVRINSSSLQVIQECKRKAKLLLMDRWVSQNESPATIFGSAIHKGLEVFYAGNPGERKLPRLEEMELMSYGHTVGTEETDLLLKSTRAFVKRAQLLKDLPESDKRSIQNGVYILWNYFKTYLEDPYVAYQDNHGPFVERQFTFRLYEDAGLAIDYFGTIDLVVRDMRTGEILVADHKTSSKVGPEFYNKIRPNHQYTGYLMAAREHFKIDTDKFLVNLVQVKDKPKTNRGTPPNFPRQITTRTAEEFEEFREAVVCAVSDYLTADAQNRWPIGHVNNCALYTGCQYLSVCSAPASLRENILKVKFTQEAK